MQHCMKCHLLYVTSFCTIEFLYNDVNTLLIHFVSFVGIVNGHSKKGKWSGNMSRSQLNLKGA